MTRTVTEPRTPDLAPVPPAPRAARTWRAPAPAGWHAVLVALAVLVVAAPTARAQDPAPRLDTLAAQLRDGGLAIDTDVVYLLDAKQRARLERRLDDARVPVRVALLPALDEDESGGDQVRQLEGLYKRIDRPGVYVVVDQRGAMEVADAQVPFRLTLSLGTLLGTGPLEGGGPTSEQTVLPRLEEILDAVESAPAGAPGPFDPTGSADETLPELHPKRGDDFVPIAIFAVIGGLLAGAALFGVTVLVAAILRGVRA